MRSTSGPSLRAHVLALGYNNQKTYPDESAEILH
jgi:hypothetical protein